MLMLRSNKTVQQYYAHWVERDKRWSTRNVRPQYPPRGTVKILKFLSFFFWRGGMLPHVPYGLRGLPSRLWPKLTDFCWSWDAHEAQLRWIWSPRRGLNLSSIKLPRPWSPWESSPSRKNPHGRTGNRTRDLMISSQKLWPLDHETGPSWNGNHNKIKCSDTSIGLRCYIIYQTVPTGRWTTIGYNCLPTTGRQLTWRVNE
jgi:hypothetical protein